jgi:DNA recombination protein RmuC
MLRERRPDARRSRESRQGAARRVKRALRSWRFQPRSIAEIEYFKTQLDGRAQTELTESNEQRLENLRSVVDLRLKQLQEDNSLQIEKMRATVDEKLQGTLEKRLGESFKLVSERLEQVHHGLGTMQQLVSDVGGLQRVLTNVKTRGGWGEVQLGALLEQVLTPEQFGRNVKTREGSGENVEFAIRLPGPENDTPVWLPIDAKFPVEDYQRLIAAQESADPIATEAAMKNLETQLRKNAKDISSKYINPPRTTDFALMFLPTEGLYAEAIRRVGLAEQVQRELRVVFAGPTTLAALLNSLQMGFALAI